MAHGFGGTKEHGLERFRSGIRSGGVRRGSCTIIAISGRATGTSAGTSIHGNRLPTGVAQSLTLRADRKLMQPVLGYGAPASRRTRSRAWRNRSAACAALLPRFQQSVNEQGLRRVSPDATLALEHAFNEDERGRLRGELPRRQAVVSGDPAVPAAYRSQDAIDFYLQRISEGIWKNEGNAALDARRAHV